MSGSIGSAYFCKGPVETIFFPHAKLTEHKALRHKLKSCTVPFLYRSDLVKSRRMLYRPDVCNWTMPYVPRTVPAYAVRDPAYTAEVFALTLVEIDVPLILCKYLTKWQKTSITIFQNIGLVVDNNGSKVQPFQ